MKKKTWIIRLGGLLLVSFTLMAVSAVAAGTAGTESDPLVTLSYLNNTFLTQMLGRVDEKLAVRDRELSDKLTEQMQKDARELSEQFGTGSESSSAAAADTFAVVTLVNGQTLYGEIGCEVMLRVGAASCVAQSSPGLIDETDGSILGGGSNLTKNHLYMMTIDERGVRATAETTKLMVRGGYTIR